MKKKYPYRVVNCGGVGSGNALNTDLNNFYALMDSEFKEGDFVIYFGRNLWSNLINFPEQMQIKFTDIFNNPPFDEIKCFIDMTEHIDETGNKIVADKIFERIESALKSQEKVAPFLDKIERKEYFDEELEKYLKILSKERVNKDKIGAIVMNCNPFTLGHMYLINEALKRIDFLYIFVVEEDKSEFSFKDRFSIVKENCKNLKNVKVLPSGKYMISSFTFAEYFNKDDLQDKNIMPAKDVNLFGNAIAPCLNIKFRFVGEEPLDNITRQYNETMKQLLKNFGVELVEIPRLKLSNGKFVNATEVRRLLKEKNFKECKKYLTKTTYKYVKKFFDSIFWRK